MKGFDPEKARKRLEGSILWVNDEIESQQEILKKNTSGSEKVVDILEHWKSGLNSTIQDMGAKKTIESEREELRAGIYEIIEEMEEEKLEVEGFPISERQLNRKRGQLIQELKNTCVDLGNWPEDNGRSIT
jgi:hypothetical protein